MRGWLGALVVGCLVLSGCTSSDERATPERTPFSPTWSPPPTMSDIAIVVTTRTVGKPVEADVDGDGRLDMVRLKASQADNETEAYEYLTARLATGRLSVSKRWMAPGGFREIYDRLQGQADVNGDGRDEVVLFTSGNTEFTGELFTWHRGRLTRVQSHDVHAVGLTFAAHGNGCGIGCSVDSTCQLVDGRPRLVLSSAIALSGRGRPLIGQELLRPDAHEELPYEQHSREWTVRVYDLVGLYLEREATHRGVASPGEPLPWPWQFDNELDCGTANWGG
jgi:hypothetical protein